MAAHVMLHIRDSLMAGSGFVKLPTTLKKRMIWELFKGYYDYAPNIC